MPRRPNARSLPTPPRTPVRGPRFVSNPTSSRSLSTGTLNALKLVAPILIKMASNYATSPSASKTKTTKTKKSVSFASSQGKTGKYAGKVTTKTKKFDNSYNEYGSVLRLETNGDINASECQYLGHSTIAPRKLLDSICRCIVKELCKQAGRSIMNWDELWETTSTGTRVWAIGYEYFTLDIPNGNSPDTDPTTTYRSILIASTNSFNQIALNLASDLHTAFVNAEKHEIIKFVLRVDNPGVSLLETPATIYANQLKLTVSGVSYMKIQNVTNAATIVGEEEGNDSRDNVNANPINYRCYDQNYKNGFMYTFKRNITGATNKFGFIANDSNAVIQYDPSDNNFNQLYKPPSPYALGLGKGKAKSSNGVINPGDIKTSYITSTKTYTFNQLLFLIADTLGDTFDYIINMGKSRLFAFEHLLKVTGDPNIRLNYQLDYTLKVKYYYKPKIVSEQIIESS